MDFTFSEIDRVVPRIAAQTADAGPLAVAWADGFGSGYGGLPFVAKYDGDEAVACAMGFEEGSAARRSPKPYRAALDRYRAICNAPRLAE